VFSNRDACVTPVLSIEESFEHEHNRQRDSFPEIEGVARPDTAPRFSRTGANAKQETPLTGQHGREILGELGYTGQQIDKLIQQQIAVLPRG